MIHFIRSPLDDFWTYVRPVFPSRYGRFIYVRCDSSAGMATSTFVTQSSQHKEIQILLSTGEVNIGNTDESVGLIHSPMKQTARKGVALHFMTVPAGRKYWGRLPDGL